MYLNSDITYRAEIHSDYVLKMVHSENGAKTLKTWKYTNSDDVIGLKQ